MAPSAPLALLLVLLLSLAETPASAPAHQGRGGWTLNSAGYLLGPVLHLPQTGDQDREREAALEILDLWKAIDRLPYARPQQVSSRSRMQTFAQPETGDLGMLRENIPQEEGA
ncbi:galanin-like peptide [Saimiri boliviensis]|uniref:galanin-like peptide n=1 Tax=Saimiri boliviensis TaxID=27679 RepID=UPI00027FC143|nr:galanin-like peptide [Saimiri boliviensis boliviensis]